jgi:hypothetical protein
MSVIDTWRIYDLVILDPYRTFRRFFLIRCILEDNPNLTDKIFRRMIKYGIDFRPYYGVSDFLDCLSNAKISTQIKAKKNWPERISKWKEEFRISIRLEKIQMMVLIIGIDAKEIYNELIKIELVSGRHLQSSVTVENIIKVGVFLLENGIRNSADEIY